MRLSCRPRLRPREIRRRAKGEADALYAKMEAEAKGIETVLKKQAAGFAEVVNAAGGDPNAALKLLIADKLEDLMRIQVDAIKNIKIDKVTVWDSGNGANGKSSTSNFLSGLMKSVPPLEEVLHSPACSSRSCLVRSWRNRRTRPLRIKRPTEESRHRMPARLKLQKLNLKSN